VRSHQIAFANLAKAPGSGDQLAAEAIEICRRVVDHVAAMVAPELARDETVILAWPTRPPSAGGFFRAWARQLLGQSAGAEGRGLGIGRDGVGCLASAGAALMGDEKKRL